MTALIPANFGSLAPAFAGTNANDDLSSGIQSSFGLIGYKGKVWSIRYRGDETPLMREDGDGARGSIEVVILKASQSVSKIWYEQGYVEGSNAAPDCFSNNGVAPEPTSAKPQCASCAACKHNAWGSRITPAGKQGKACADSKRLAVVPADDIGNEMFGGPMLLRVPAASLQDLAMYGQKMQQMGYPYYSVATRIAFDPNEAYPKFTFSAIRPLKADEAPLILAERDGHQVNRILSESEFTPAEAAPVQSLASVFEQPPEEPAKPAAKSETIAADVAAAKAKTDAAAKAAKAAEAKAKKEAMAKAIAEAEAEAAKTVTPEVTEEDEDDAELREMEAALAAARAKKQNAVASTAVTQPHIVEDPAPKQATSATASPSDAPMSDFESELDDMLDSLIPS